MVLFKFFEYIGNGKLIIVIEGIFVGDVVMCDELGWMV